MRAEVLPRGADETIGKLVMNFATHATVVSANARARDNRPPRSLNSLERACERGGSSQQQLSLFAGRTCCPFGIDPSQIIDELALVAAVGGERGGAARVKFPDLDFEGSGIDDHSNTDIRDPAGSLGSPASDRLHALRVVLTPGQGDQYLDFLRDPIAIPAEFAGEDFRERCFESSRLNRRSATGKDHARG